MKHCKDCKYYRSSYSEFVSGNPYGVHLCTHLEGITSKEDYNEKIEYYSTTHYMRVDTNICGPEAKLYKPTLLKRLFK